MKKMIVVTVALAFVLLSAGAALAALAGSKHDMRTYLTGQTGGYDEVCVYCHTPHSASMTAQLWNHTASSVGSYQTYTNTWGTLQSVPGTPGNGSLLCLSCHDGTVAVDNLVNPPNSGSQGSNDGGGELNASKYITSGRASNFSTDLRNDHPIGFAYNASLVTNDGGLVDANTVGNSTYVRIINGIGGTVECATCHDAHNTTVPPFLRSSNAASALCTRCHTK